VFFRLKIFLFWVAWCEFIGKRTAMRDAQLSSEPGVRPLARPTLKVHFIIHLYVLVLFAWGQYEDFYEFMSTDKRPLYVSRKALNCR
jgi:hypothetical protein